MKRLVLALLLIAQSALGVDIFSVPVQFTTGSSLTINSGVPLGGTWAFSGATVDMTGATAINFPAGTVTLTGNVTGSGSGSFATTVVTIPDLVSAPGSILWTNVGAPAAPAAGFIKTYANSTDKRFHDVNDAGTTGTTVVANTGSANNFVTAISTAGVLTLAQPTFTNLGGSLPLTQLASQAANTVVGNATGGTAVPTAVTPATARTNSLLNIDQKTTVGDAPYTILSTDRTVVTSATFTAPRIWTLPAANSVNPGQILYIADQKGGVTSTNTLTVTRAGSDVILPGLLTSYVLTQPFSGVTIQSDGVNQWQIFSYQPGKTPVDYTLNSDGNNSRSYPTGLSSSSVSTVSAGYAADTYVAGSAITVAAGDFKAQGQYHCVFDMAKTAAGVATPIITLRMGTLGTTGDAAIQTLTFTAGTAAADTGTFEVWVTFRTVGSGTAAVVAVTGACVHNGGTTGLVNVNSNVVAAVSAGFASNTPTKIGLSFNGGASFSGTNTNVQAQLTQP